MKSLELCTGAIEPEDMISIVFLIQNTDTAVSNSEKKLHIKTIFAKHGYQPISLHITAVLHMVQPVMAALSDLRVHGDS